MQVYLDNSATTRPRNEVIDVMNYMLREAYGNPSSLHRMGLEVEKKIVEARGVIANFLGVSQEEIFFTSGGTESNNIAIQGIINKNVRKGKHIITTKIEHSSVLNIFKRYEERGWDVTYLDVDNHGLVDLEKLELAIRGDTVLLAVMMVNNEIGTIQPITEIKNIIKRKNKDVKLHIDGIQAFGKIPLSIKAMGIDSFSFSGHKFHGPKGVGGLYVNKNINVEPIIFGGNQERGLRSGTENVPGIVGLGKAVEILKERYDIEKQHILNLKMYFLDEVTKRIDNIKINSFTDEMCAPHILNISFAGVRGEVLLHYLEEDGVFVSTGSACSSHKKSKSHVLKAIGLNDKDIEGTVRFSFAFSNTREELEHGLNSLEKAVGEIRKITMR